MYHPKLQKFKQDGGTKRKRGERKSGSRNLSSSTLEIQRRRRKREEIWVTWGIFGCKSSVYALYMAGHTYNIGVACGLPIKIRVKIKYNQPQEQQQLATCTLNLIFCNPYLSVSKIQARCFFFSLYERTSSTLLKELLDWIQQIILSSFYPYPTIVFT